MKILLINNNPVVSRLTALSARKENIDIDEIQEVTELSSDKYDIVFVDSDSLTKDVKETIKEHLKVKKMVLFYSDGDEEDKEEFDITILKPFLPSEVSAVIRSVEEMVEEEEEKHFNVLDEVNISEKEELFGLNYLVEPELKNEPVVDETKYSFDKKLEEAFPLKINTLEDDLFEEKEPEKKDEIVKDKELFELNIDDKLTLEDELFSKETTKTNKTLDFEDDKNFLNIEDEPLLVLEEDKEKKEEKVEESVLETKILDKNEIENIKGLLSEDTNSNDMTLEDLMTPPAMVEKVEDEEKKSKKKKVKKDKENISVDSDVIVQSLSALSIEGLRELLAGARVNINIKFPKAK